MSTASNLALRSLITKDGELTLSIDDIGVPTLGADQVLVRVDAAPINPSDIGLLFGPADMTTAQFGYEAARPTVRATVGKSMLASLHARLDKPQAVGNEGAGLVTHAGSSPAAQALLGKKVAVVVGGMFAQHRAVPVDQCLVLPDDVSAVEGAAAFVNPLTVLCMIEAMRLEGHTAMVHTAAAGALGQMLVRACKEDGIPLVNIVRKAEQVELLRSLGAEHVVDSTSASFLTELRDAIAATGATLAFDALGGGKLAGQILGAMEQVLVGKMKHYSRYGSDTHKQVYLYGALDTQPTELRRNYGMAWSIGGWLIFPFLTRIGAARGEALKSRIARSLKTTFATSYTKKISLAEALTPEVLAGFAKRATGEKYLIEPNR